MVFNKFLNVCYNVALLVIFTIANVLVLSSLLFLCHISINVFHLPLSFIIALIELYFIRKDSVKTIFISGILTILVFLFSMFLCGKVYDVSYDGNSYHKEAIGFLKNGWNPIYESAEKFAKNNEFEVASAVWTNYYPKATWIYGASVYKITNNIETAKTFNFLILFVVFFIIVYLVNKFEGKKIFSLLVAFSVFLFPIIWQQFFSLYLDGFLGFILLLVVIYMYLLIKDENNKEYFVIIGSLLIIIINLKYSGLLYAGLFCLGYYFYYFICKIMAKEYRNLINFTLKFVLILAIAILVVGSNSYVSNTLKKHNPLYPLVGKDKVDIMTDLQPRSFAKKSPIKKQFYSIFSYSANVGAFNNGEPILKKPFDKTLAEMTVFGEDTRIGGFGVYFSGILIISLIVIFLRFTWCIVARKYDDLVMFGIPFVIIIAIMFLVSDAWWARYSPQTYFIPLMATFILLKNNAWILKIFGFCLIYLCLQNSYIIYDTVSNKTFPISAKTRQNLANVANEKIDIEMNSDNFTGTLFNLKDYNIDYKIKRIEDKKELYVGKIACEVRK